MIQIKELSKSIETQDVKQEALQQEIKTLKFQLEESAKEKELLLESMQAMETENKQTIESSVFLTEKNIKSFIRKYLTRLMKIWKTGVFEDEFEMCFDSLTQSLEYGFAEKQELLKLLSE